jgi:hypothetical protein
MMAASAGAGQTAEIIPFVMALLPVRGGAALGRKRLWQSRAAAGEPDSLSPTHFVDRGQSIVSRAGLRFSHDLKRQAPAIGLLKIA